MHSCSLELPDKLRVRHQYSERGKKKKASSAEKFLKCKHAIPMEKLRLLREEENTQALSRENEKEQGMIMYI